MNFSRRGSKMLEKRIPPLLVLLFISFPLFSQVNRAELEQSQGPVIFLNYEGPQARIETREQIRNIGYSLGQEARRGSLPGTRPRYFVIHSVSPAEGNKLDADIFGLGADVGVDHIRNLRLIIQGYLEGAYAYSAGDAALLAEYITVYNAVYRGSWAYFSQRYKTAVIQHLDAGRAGISTRFDEWPGRTLMLIPLGTGSPGSLSAVDTSAVSDTNVLDELRKEDDRSIEQRRELADLKDREAGEAEQRAQGQREAIAEEEKRISREREEAGQERESIQEERRQTQQAAASGEISGEEARRREEDLAARETAADSKEQELRQREETLVEQREEARQDEERAEQKREEAQQDRESIEKDQREIAAEARETVVRDQGKSSETREEPGVLQEPGALGVNRVIGTSLERPDSPLGRVVQMDSNTGTELRRSGFNAVNGRTLAFAGGRLLAIAGENRGSGVIRLVEIDMDSLEIVSQGNDDIHPDSLLWVNGADLYAITVSEGGAYLSRFDTLLARQARSEAAVHPLAAVSFQSGLLITQRSDGSVLILNPRDLTEN
jgi:hypothetical protein